MRAGGDMEVIRSILLSGDPGAKREAQLNRGRLRQRRCRQRHVSKIAAYQRDYRARNRESLQAYNREYRREHREQCNASRRMLYWRSKEYREKALQRSSEQRQRESVSA